MSHRYSTQGPPSTEHNVSPAQHCIVRSLRSRKNQDSTRHLMQEAAVASLRLLLRVEIAVKHLPNEKYADFVHWLS